MIKRGFKSLPSIVIFCAIFVNFILVSTYWIDDVAIFVHFVRYSLMDQTSATFNSKTIADFNEISWRHAITQGVFQQLMGMGHHFDKQVDDGISHSSGGHKHWLHLQSQKALGLHKKPPQVFKVLAIIIDTGVAFLLLQGLNILLNFLPYERYSAVDFFQIVIFSAYALLTGMYPTIVIYLVNQQRSLVEVFALSDTNGNGTPEVPFDRTITIGPLECPYPDTTADATSLTDVSEWDMSSSDTDKDSFIGREKAREMV
ncbi:hypothetical protein C0995_010001 [Termitomyces sp. Mi166|nr:hypothetical protein C0995_010001 [Termitomyces sp. Mi166\